MKKPISDVSHQILDLVSRKGGITLLELEQELDVSYNLIFLAIDHMVTNNQIHLKRYGRDYLLSKVVHQNSFILEDSCTNEYLCQDI